MAGFPGPRALPTIVMLLAMVVANLVVWPRYLRVTLRPDEGEHIILTGLRSGHVPSWVLLPAAVLLAAGLAAQVWALWTLSGRRAGPVPAPADPERQLANTGT
jgi:hypothetical protein